MKINKLDGARRQLLAAIHLHWFFLEPLVVYQLAANASEVCDSLISASGGMRMREEIASVHGWTEKDVNIIINGPRNFVKHADRNPHDEIDEIGFDECDAMLLTACVDYCLASKRSPAIVGLFVAWYAAKNPDKTGDFFADVGDTVFPNLTALDHAGQIAAARKQAQSVLTSDILRDPRTEMTDNWRWAELQREGQGYRFLST
ncbi:hypothetical protein [Agrobacterium tumefaciens]|uniref:hypothetical protein n=1 Tax=Agrobacterium tumefaciens TaxID=358 RepID=UPI003BA35703